MRTKKLQKNQMTTRQRWLAAIKKEPVDRLPFWPKLNNAYISTQSRPFKKMGLEGLHDWIGSDKHIWLPSAIVEKRSLTSEGITEENNLRRIKYTTRYGSTENILKYDNVSDSWHPVKMAINNLKEIEIMTAYFEDSRPYMDKDILKEAFNMKKRIGEDAVFATAVGESPLMDFIEWFAGVQNAHILIADHGDKVKELFSAMHETLIKKTQIISEHNPADLVHFFDNTSTTLISPDQFREYPLKHLNKYGNIIRGNEKICILHMCGHLKALLKDINSINADAIESFTSPPVGNTRFIDGKKLCPSKSLIGGTNAVLWTKSPNEIIKEIRRDLDKLDEHRGIVITSGGVMPPVCRPEVIKEVCEFVKSYKIRA